MNSSLLVPALVVVAVTAGVFLFGDGLFSDGGSSDHAGKYVVAKTTKTKNSTDAMDTGVSSDSGSEFSWDEGVDDEQPPLQGATPVQRPTESFVNMKQSDEAPGALFGSEFDSTADESFDSDDGFATALPKTRTSKTSADSDAENFETAFDFQSSSKQVDDDLSDFFNSAIKTSDSQSSPKRSEVFASSTAKTATAREKAPESSGLDLGLASPKSSARSIEDFESASSALSTARRRKTNEEVNSVMVPRESKSLAEKVDSVSSDANAGGVFSGALEPVKASKSLAVGGSASNIAKSSMRKFKITNPKETTLTVTLSVDGKQVTLKPDQSFVLQQSDRDVEVVFSRGGSFGFETKRLKNGHYRFTVSREAGWQLLN